MTSRHLLFTSSLFIGCQGLALTVVPFAQAQTGATPALSPAQGVSSHIAPTRNVAHPRFDKPSLVMATPATDAPSRDLSTLPQVPAAQTAPSTAKSVIAAPRPIPGRLSTPFAPAPSSPMAVPFVPAPGAKPVMPMVSTAPVANAPAVASAVPRTIVAKPLATPAPVSTEEKAESADDKANRLLLARLESDLDEASRRLDRAKGKISEGERQLSQFTDVLQRAMMEAGPDARGLNPFVRVAQRYRGTPYVWGGVSARGFDCSGFIIRVMRDLGYRALPHSAAEQFRYGMPIAEQLLKPGDLVFFANTYKPGISHVGIYLGRRRFIHAANSHVGTIVSSLDEAKWSAKYAGGRRLIPVTS
jgi:cell wall-associated NlpC family hydrolase